MSNEKKIILELKSDPFASDPINASDFYDTLGKFIIVWGRFETHVNHILFIILNLPQATDLQQELPLSWKKRAELWRKAFTKLPILAPLKEYALTLIIDIMSNAQDRHFLAHASWGDFTSTNPLTMRASSMRPKKDKVEFTSRDLSIDDIRKIIEDIDSLNSRLLKITLKLINLNPRLPRERFITKN